MVKVSTIAIAGGTVLLAAGAGMFMQMNGQEVEPVQVAAFNETPALAAGTGEEISGLTAVELDSITLTSSDLPASVAVSVDVVPLKQPVTKLRPYEPAQPFAPILASIEAEDDLNISPRDDVQPMAEPALPTETEVGDACLVDMIGEPRAAAMVHLHLTAPCQPNARVSFEHEGMKFTALTDADGALEVVVPALSETATFLAFLDDGNAAAVEMNVDTLGFYDRSVVQWQGDSGIELHALEYGASWEGEGHVWSGAPRDAVIAARGEGGFLTRLGDASVDGARMAEVYTFPTGTAKAAGDVAVSIEIAVTEANCGQDLRADVIEVEDARADKPGELSLTVPDCDAIGDFIQLKNLVRDLKIAAR